MLSFNILWKYFPVCTYSLSSNGQEKRWKCCARHCWPDIPRMKEWPWWLSSRKKVVGSEHMPPTETYWKASFMLILSVWGDFLMERKISSVSMETCVEIQKDVWSQQSYYLDSKEKEHKKGMRSNLKESHQICVLCPEQTLTLIN